MAQAANSEIASSVGQARRLTQSQAVDRLPWEATVGLVLARRSILLAKLSLAVACSPSYRLVEHPTASTPLHRESVWASHFLLGFVGSKEIDLRDHCKTGEPLEVRQKVDLLPLLVWCTTFGIYTPSRIVITCSDSPNPRGTGKREGHGFVSAPRRRDPEVHGRRPSQTSARRRGSQTAPRDDQSVVAPSDFTGSHALP